ncbi:MAG TPA: RNA-binding protein [Bacteroidia bacterium]|nr:RNA-binding protein [Bacteroidia bacterium]
MKLFVGNVDFKATEDQLANLFADYGDVNSVKIITDKVTGRSKGFAFIEMDNDDQAEQAIENLNGYEFNSRALAVSKAIPREDKPQGGGRGNYGNNNRGGGGYNRNNRY